MNYEFTKKQIDQVKKWKKSLPKYNRIQYIDWIMFSSNEIGIYVKVRREYENGKVFELDITDVETW